MIENNEFNPEVEWDIETRRKVLSDMEFIRGHYHTAVEHAKRLKQFVEWQPIASILQAMAEPLELMRRDGSIEIGRWIYSRSMLQPNPSALAPNEVVAWRRIR